MIFYILLIAAYLIGSVSSAILICKTLGLPDPRTQGSNNPGATNVRRIAGNKVAAVVLLGDTFKGFLPVLMATTLDLSLFEISLIGLGAFLGHIYPVFFNFKGGKGVATYVGILLACSTLVGIAFICIWLFIAKVLKISSLSALVATAISPVYYYLAADDARSAIVITLICVLIFYTHRSNIKRLINDEEDDIKS
ncbi:MAG: glycerol-3-phosphate 1-O-acyltransferase PlsY [Gammaproteobacteria bacterium]|nr:glycerol-3-phosphate 1-O-acyltransferase PlsY [Gammaproteobacteria bacterium]